MKERKALYSALSHFDGAFHDRTIEDFSGGVALHGGTRSEKKLKGAVNMMAEGQSLRTVAPPVPAFPDLPEGEFHGSLCKGGIWLFGVGDRLYALRDGILSLVGEAGLLESGSVGIYETEEGFAVLNGENVFLVDRYLNVTSPTLRIPTVLRNVTPDGAAYEMGEGIHPFCRYAEILFRPVTEGDSVALFTLPSVLAVDESYILVFQEGNPAPLTAGVQYTFDGQTVRLTGATRKAVRLRLRLADSLDPDRLSFTSVKNLRELLTAEGEKIPLSLPAAKHSYILCHEGKATVLRLSETADFGDLSADRLFPIPLWERVTAIREYGEGYLIFSAGGIRKCRFAEGEEGILLMENTLIKGDFGSDMAGSICQFDDKLVFACSAGGVFCLSREGDTERIIRVSCNIEGTGGFFSHGEEEYGNAAATCAFGKYFLTVGNTTYVWDYTARLPKSQERSEEERMVWWMLSMMHPSVYTAVLHHRLYFAERETGRLCFFSPDAGEDATSSFAETAGIDLGTRAEKTLFSVTAEYRSEGELTLSLSYDGKESPALYYIPPAKEGGRYTVRLPQKRFYRCSARLAGEEAFAVSGLTYRYLTAE